MGEADQPLVLLISTLFFSFSHTNITFHSLNLVDNSISEAGFMNLDGHGNVIFVDCEVREYGLFSKGGENWRILFHTTLFKGLFSPNTKSATKSTFQHRKLHNNGEIRYFDYDETGIAYLVDCQFMGFNYSFKLFFNGGIREMNIANTSFAYTRVNTYGVIVIVRNCKFSAASITVTYIGPERSPVIYTNNYHKNDKEESGNGYTLSIYDSNFNGGGFSKDQFGKSVLPYVDLKTITLVGIIKNCEFRGSSSGVITVLHARSLTLSHIRVENNTRTNSYKDMLESDHGAILYFQFSNVFIYNSTIRDNYVFSPTLSTLRWENNDFSQTKYLTIENTYIETPHYSTFTETVGVYILRDLQNPLKSLVFGGNVILSCGRNANVTFYNFLEYVILVCFKCNENEYNMKESRVEWNPDKRIDPVGFDVFSITKCYQCPYQAVCNNNTNYIRSKGNYWGFVTTSYQAKFLTCPESYCCDSPATCLTYNTCAEHRDGILCSDCKEGYSHSLFADGRCVVNDSCGKSYFWFSYVSIAFFYGIVFLYLREIIVFLKRFPNTVRECTKNRRRRSSNGNISHGQSLIDNEDMEESSLDRSQSPYLFIEEVITESSSFEESVIVSGIIKITFFFYQVGTLVRINTSTKQEYNFPFIVDVLVSLFNVKIETSSSNFDVCLTKHASVIFNEAVKSSMLIIFPIILLLMIRLLEFWSRLKNYINKRRDINRGTTITSNNEIQFSQIDDKIPSYSKLPFHVRIKCTYIQLLLIGFMSIAVLSLKLVNCVNVNDTKHLFIQGSIECYTIWQYFVMAGICVWVVPFCFSLHGGYHLLNKCRITPNQFLYIVTFPPAVIWYFIKSKCTRVEATLANPDAMLAKHLLRVISEPFRDSSTDGVRLQWESTLIFRKLLLVVTSVFVVSPIQRLYPLGFLMTLFTIQHVFIRPYREDVLNRLESSSLGMLCFLTLLNNFWAFTDEVEIRNNSILMGLGRFFLYLELGIMILPVVVIMMYPLFLCCKKLYKKFTVKHD